MSERPDGIGYAGTEVRRRRRRRPGAPGTSAQDWVARIPYMIVLTGVTAGLGLCSLHYFRKGSVLIAAALLFGALARLVLPESRLRMLAVRSRSFDCWTLVILGEAVAFVALSVPPMHRAGLMIAAGFGVLIAVVFVVRGIRFLLRRHGTGQAQV
ncbi:DUF3017 domain-containing protein [Actinomadura sp. SCN-SB]|uniref:DUF3017 domain-containing protein n=1 Tax=Actinomadura sp. SCN-SB TaxID=3373092 RepID=UPI00375397F2